MNEVSKFHLANRESLSLPSSWGGWGFKQLGLFNISLCVKILWHGLTRTGLWEEIISAKFMKRIHFRLGFVMRITILLVHWWFGAVCVLLFLLSSVI